MAESENKKFSVFKIKSSIETKNDSLLFERWVLSRQLMSAYTTPTLEGLQLLFTCLLAFISRSNLAFAKSSWALTPVFNFFLLLSEVVAQICSVKKVLLEILQNWQENTSARISGQACIKEILAQVFSCEFCKIFKNTFSYRAPSVAAFVL